MTDHIRADCTIPVREVERLREVERKAGDLIAHEFVAEAEWKHGWKAHRAETLKRLKALRAALEGK